MFSLIHKKKEDIDKLVRCVYAYNISNRELVVGINYKLENFNKIISDFIGYNANLQFINKGNRLVISLFGSEIILLDVNYEGSWIRNPKYDLNDRYAVDEDDYFIFNYENSFGYDIYRNNEIIKSEKIENYEIKPYSRLYHEYSYHPMELREVAYYKDILYEKDESKIITKSATKR